MIGAWRAHGLAMIVQSGGALALLGWLVAFACGMKLLMAHRAEGKSASYYLPRGAVWFVRTNWAPSGRSTHTAMLGGMGLLAIGLAIAALGIVLSS